MIDLTGKERRELSEYQAIGGSRSRTKMENHLLLLKLCKRRGKLILSFLNSFINSIFWWICANRIYCPAIGNWPIIKTGFR